MKVLGLIFFSLLFSFVLSNEDLKFDFKWTDTPPKPWVNTEPHEKFEIDPDVDTAESAFVKLKSRMAEPLSERCLARKKEDLEDMFYQMRERIIKNGWTMFSDPNDYIDDYFANGEILPPTTTPAFPPEFFERERANQFKKNQN